MSTANSSSLHLLELSTYTDCLAWIQSQCPPELRKPSLGLVLGSGLGSIVNSIDATRPNITLDYTDIPHFPQTTVIGHSGKMVIGYLNDTLSCIMMGRFHIYEGYAPITTTLPIRIMHMMGVKTLFVTNAAGGLNPDFSPGDFMVIQDHLGFAGMGGLSPLIGANIPSFGARFPPISKSYSMPLRVIAFRAAQYLHILDSVHEGTYTFVPGPSFESRAEARFLRESGGDCVGMSTVPEVITAVHCGMDVLGLSLITNRVACSIGKSAKKIVMGGGDEGDEGMLATHEEVLETSAKRATVFVQWVLAIIKLVEE